MYIGHNISTHIHAHHALQIAISLDIPFQIQVEEHIWNKAQGIIIGPDQKHNCIAPQNKVIYISLDPESISALKLKHKYLLKTPSSPLDHEIVSQFIKQINEEIQNNNDILSVSFLLDDFLHQILKGSPHVSKPNAILDTRILRLIQILKELHEKTIPLKELAQEVGLSSGRLVHLFKEQMGIPIRKYILWLKMNQAIYAISQKKNLTEAAHSAGFSDSAHFSRTFLRMFGIPPSEILKNSQIIQASSFHI